MVVRCCLPSQVSLSSIMPKQTVAAPPGPGRRSILHRCASDAPHADDRVGPVAGVGERASAAHKRRQQVSRQQPARRTILRLCWQPQRLLEINEEQRLRRATSAPRAPTAIAARAGARGAPCLSAISACACLMRCVCARSFTFTCNGVCN